jgi:hypothetical protein
MPFANSLGQMRTRFKIRGGLVILGLMFALWLIFFGMPKNTLNLQAKQAPPPAVAHKLEETLLPTSARPMTGSVDVAQASGTSCCHSEGKCQLGSSAVVGSLCYCPSTQGPIRGSVC